MSLFLSHGTLPRQQLPPRFGRPGSIGRTLPVLLALWALASCQAESDSRVLKLAHSLDTSHPVHRAMVHMAERTAELSGGDMRIEIHPSGQLGEERELIEMLQIGSIAMTKVSASPLESFVPEMKVFSIPFVFRDQEHLWRVLDGEIGEDLLAAGIGYRLRGLAYYDAGPRSFYTTDVPVHTPEDLTGLKIRVQKSYTASQMVQVLGGSATPIDWGELYSALQQGVVDGAENNLPSFYLSRHYEVSPFYTMDEHTWVPDVLLISTHVWDGLTPQEREWLGEAARSSETEQRRLWRESTLEALAAVEAAGVQVIQPDKGAFRRAAEPMFETYRGTGTYDLIRTIQGIR